MRFPHCKGGCGNRLVAPSEANAVLKGGRRRSYRGGYCESCWRARAVDRSEQIAATLTPEQLAVLALLENEVADEAERRDFAQALGLVGEPT